MMQSLIQHGCTLQQVADESLLAMYPITYHLPTHKD